MLDVESAKTKWQLPVRLRVLNFIRSWVEGYFDHDFGVCTSETMCVCLGRI
jgi:hypothetical protein